jgi:hypothetical protein
MQACSFCVAHPISSLYQGFKLGFPNGNQYAPDEDHCN